MKINEECILPVGFRDACHVPFVVVEVDNYYDFRPGDWVRFKDTSMKTIEHCEHHKAHGVVNPFLETFYRKFLVMLMPDVNTPVRHVFDLDLVKLAEKEHRLTSELAEAVEQEAESCKDCWSIINNSVQRG